MIEEILEGLRVKFQPILTQKTGSGLKITKKFVKKLYFLKKFDFEMHQYKLYKYFVTSLCENFHYFFLILCQKSL